MIQMPTPRQTAPVPVKSTGTSWAIQGNRPVIEALKRVDVIVDCTVEGLIHAPEWPEIEEAGRARLLVICNEHPRILERTEPKAELGRGRYRHPIAARCPRNARHLRRRHGPRHRPAQRPLRRHAGFGTTPGSVAHWPGGLCLAFPGKNCVNGRIVMDVGDMNLTLKSTLTSRIDFTVEDDLSPQSRATGVRCHPLPRVTWPPGRPQRLRHEPCRLGHEPHARWVSAAMYDKRDMQAVEFRALAGSFLWSTGANQYAGRYTLGHFDLPMRNCTIALDGKVVVKGRRPSRRTGGMMTFGENA